MWSGMPQWQQHSTPAASRSSPAPCGTQESSGSAVGGGTGWPDTQGGGGGGGGECGGLCCPTRFLHRSRQFFYVMFLAENLS